MTDEKCRSVPKEKCRNVPRQECKKVRKHRGNQKKFFFEKYLGNQKKVQRKTSRKLSNIIRRLKNIFLRCQNSSVRPRYPAMGEGGNECCLNMVRRKKQRRNLISFLSTMMSEYGERGKAKKKFKFFLIYYAVWIWWEEKQKRKLLSFSTIFNECCLNMGRRKSKEEICIISYLLWYLNMVRGKKEICILSFLAFSGYAVQTPDMSHGGGEETNTKLWYYRFHSSHFSVVHLFIYLFLFISSFNCYCLWYQC